MAEVLIVAPGFPPVVGGVEHHVARLAAALRGDGWDVVVAVPHAGPRDSIRTLSGTTVERFPLTLRSRRYPMSLGLHRWVRANASRFAIVHAQSFHALPALATLAAPPERLIFTPHFHGGGHTAAARMMHLVYGPFGSRIFRRARTVICVSDSEAELVGDAYPGVEPVVIPNGVDVPTGKPLTDPTPLVISGGRVEPYKNVEGVIAAAEHLPVGVRMVLTGTGSDSPALARLGADAIADGRLRLMGELSRANLERLQAAATVYVSLSAHEAFNLAAYETASAGARLVLSDIPAHRDVASRLAPGTVQLVAPDIAPALLADVIGQSVRSGRIAVQRPLPCWTDVARTTADVYRTALGVPVAA